MVTRAQLDKLASRIEGVAARLGIQKPRPTRIIITYVEPSEDGPRPCERVVYGEGHTVIERLIFQDGKWVEAQDGGEAGIG